MAIKNNILAVGCLAMLMLSACTADNDPAAEQEIALTTPVIELGGVEASASRGAATWDDMVSYAGLTLYMQDAQNEQVGNEARYAYDSSWRVNAPATVKGGPGSYRAGIKAYINLNENESTGMPAIEAAWYGYRGAIDVQADGSFAPMGALQPLSSAVQWKLKDANGNDITQSDKYLIRPVGLARMFDFTNGDDGNWFPNGTAAPVPQAEDYSAISYLAGVYGDYTPGTYPATWLENKLVTSDDVPTDPWVLAEVVYCKDGFGWSDETLSYEPSGNEFTTWTVSYPAQRLTLEAGKLYTFTITLGKDAHITLGRNAVSIAGWGPGEQIEVGK